jgi:hypothetical protein
MRISIVGTGSVGAALARAWSTRDHDITLVVRDPDRPATRELAEETGAEVATPGPEAVADADVVVLALPATAAAEVGAALGGLAGLVVVDPTNPIADDFSSLTVGTTSSNAEQIAAALPEARVVKAFNTIGAHLFDRPDIDGNAPSMFIAGDDADAKLVVDSLAAELGFDPVDVGGLSEARFLEPMAMLWIRLTYVEQAGTVGFRLLRQ